MSRRASRSAARLALDQAGVTLHDVAMMDIYSCFPSAVQIALKEIGISATDPRGLTVTGGALPTTPQRTHHCVLPP